MKAPQTRPSGVAEAHPLRRILELECARGFADAAVWGGLDAYLRRQMDRAGGRVFEFELPNPSYASLDVKSRSLWVERALKYLDGLESGSQSMARAMGARIPSGKASQAGHSSRVAKKAPAVESLDSPITCVRGVSSALALRFNRLGVRTLRDLLYLFPRRHNDFSRITTVSQLKVGMEQTVIATVWEAREKLIGRTMRGTEAIVGDETGNIRVVWFNQPYLARRLKVNEKVVLSGRVNIFNGRKVLESPEYELLESQELIHTGRLVPVYPLTEGLGPRTARRVVKEALDRWTPALKDFLPGDVREKAQLMELPRAIEQAHYPEGEGQKDEARKRLAFDELFLMQLSVMRRKREWQEGGQSPVIRTNPMLLEAFLSSLPFTLTHAQRRALDEVLADIASTRPMSRLLQGEVGSGKTVVATAALLVAAAQGFQAAFMAPTEILAEQHFASISSLLAGLAKPVGEGNLLCAYVGPISRPITLGLLTGSLKKKEKEELHWRLSQGSIDIIIGTHALIQKEVEFERLALVVVDEQHRFGVMQRSALRQKADASVHLLVMTATPIPRSLCLTIFGDLDLSVIDELPPGRQEIETRWIPPDQRMEAYRFLRKEAEAGRQAFIICPLIEESQSIEARAATIEFQRLSKEVFPDLRLGLLHGRMRSEAKEEVMRLFRSGGLDVLVSTAVVEVGIDVPNATVMLVEGADRFGLSQLHQFRGRVGRGNHKSYCLLLADYPSWEGRERLSIIERVQDGFLLAEEDMRLRGPGEFFGTRQSGLPDLRMARLSDLALLELAREEAIRLFEEDPKLEMERNRPLALELARLGTIWQVPVTEA